MPIIVNSSSGVSTNASLPIEEMRRSVTEAAPETIWFGPNWSSASGFSQSGPTGSDIYDPRFHEVDYFWDFDDAGTY